jgi:hypothetical protein
MRLREGDNVLHVVRIPLGDTALDSAMLDARALHGMQGITRVTRYTCNPSPRALHGMQGIRWQGAARDKRRWRGVASYDAFVVALG